MLLRNYLPPPTDDVQDDHRRSKNLETAVKRNKFKEYKVLFEFEILNKNTFWLNFHHSFSVILVFVMYLITVGIVQMVCYEWYLKHHKAFFLHTYVPVI